MGWKDKLIGYLVSALLSLLDEAKLKSVVDVMLDKIEDSVIASTNKIDDKIILPLCAKLREVIDIPDNVE